MFSSLSPSLAFDTPPPFPLLADGLAFSITESHILYPATISTNTLAPIATCFNACLLLWKECPCFCLPNPSNCALVRCLFLSFSQGRHISNGPSIPGINKLCLLWKQNSTRIKRCYNVYQLNKTKHCFLIHILILFSIFFLKNFFKEIKIVACKFSCWIAC